MRDPDEGRADDGMIRTGARLERIAPGFRRVLDDVVREIGSPGVSVYVYGSVATGQAMAGRSDVDVLTIGLAAEDAERLGRDLTERHADVCRGVEIGPAAPDDFLGDHDEAYGNRVFLRHYCVHLAGPDDLRPGHDFPADARAARGFNGDIGAHRDRWRAALERGDDPGPLARGVARKSLLAVAGLVSVRDGTWTTGREHAAHRWSEIEPGWADGAETLLEWFDQVPTIDAADVAGSLDHVVDPLVVRFAAEIGLWA